MSDASSTPLDRLGRLTDLATPYAVRVLATLRVPDLIADGVTGLDELARAVAADPDALARLLRFLVHSEVLAEPEPGVFGLTEVGELLRCLYGAAGQRDWLDLDGLGQRMDHAYTGLLHSVRTGEPSYEVVNGRTFWADMDAVPAYARYLDDLMMSQHLHTAPQVAALYDWAPVKHVVDVGGGSGALLVELLRSHPHLYGTLVDRPHPAASTAQRFADNGLADRAEIVVGDFFSHLPPGGDVYIISRAITDWGDRDAARILRTIGVAAGVSGRVVMVEVLPSEPHVPHAGPFDLQMLAVVGGRERTLADFEVLAADAGLRVTRVLRGRDGLALIECADATVTGDGGEGG